MTELAAAEATTQDRVLRLVVEHGPVSAGQLARMLELTPAGVRRHIAALEEQERIVAHEQAPTANRSRGRPARHYVATDSGRGELSHGYANIANQALDYLSTIAGPQAVAGFAAEQIAGLEERYATRIEEAGDDLAARTRVLAEALTEDGYAATARDLPGGLAVQLCQGNCPVLAVAESYPQLCEAETRAFSRLLGVHVQRLATLAGGEHVCTTHVPVLIPVNENRSSATPSPAGEDTEGTK